MISVNNFKGLSQQESIKRKGPEIKTGPGQSKVKWERERERERERAVQIQIWSCMYILRFSSFQLCYSNCNVIELLWKFLLENLYTLAIFLSICA